MRISDWSSDVCSSDLVASGDILAESETDKATMEFEAVDEGTIADIAIPEGTDGVKVGTVIALLVAEGEDVSAPKEKSPARKQKATEAEKGPAPEPGPAKPAKAESAAQALAAAREATSSAADPKLAEGADVVATTGRRGLRGGGAKETGAS